MLASPKESAQGCLSPRTKRFAPFCAGEELVPSITHPICRANAPLRRFGQSGIRNRTVWAYAGFETLWPSLESLKTLLTAAVGVCGITLREAGPAKSHIAV